MTEFRFRWFDGYGLVVAVVGDGPARFIYLAGEPPQGIRDACEGQEKQLVSLVAAQGREPVAVARSVEKRTQRALRWCLDQFQDFLFEWPHLAALLRSRADAIRSSDERQGADASAGESAGENGEDRQVGVQLRPVDSSNAEGHSPVGQRHLVALRL